MSRVLKFTGWILKGYWESGNFNVLSDRLQYGHKLTRWVSTHDACSQEPLGFNSEYRDAIDQANGTIVANFENEIGLGIGSGLALGCDTGVASW